VFEPRVEHSGHHNFHAGVDALHKGFLSNARHFFMSTPIAASMITLSEQVINASSIGLDDDDGWQNWS